MLSADTVPDINPPFVARFDDVSRRVVSQRNRLLPDEKMGKMRRPDAGCASIPSDTLSTNSTSSMAATFAKVAVVGAGAVGSFFGAMLARAGHRVDADRAGRRMSRRSSATGLRLDMARPRRSDRASRPATTSPPCAAPTSCSSASSRPTPRRWRSAMAPHLDRRRARAQPAERRRERGDDRAARAPAGRAGGGLRRHGDAGAGRSSATTAAAISSSARSTRRRRRSRRWPARAAGTGRPVRDRRGAGARSRPTSWPSCGRS